MIEKKQIYASYKSQNKWLGIIDYKSLTIIIIYTLIIFLFIKNLNFNFTLSFYIFSIFVSPVFVILCFNIKDDSAIDILIIIIIFLRKRKIYTNLNQLSTKKEYIYKKLN